MESYIDISELTMEQLQSLAGVNDSNYQLIENAFNVLILSKNGQLLIKGNTTNDVQSANETMEALIQDVMRNQLEDHVTRYEIAKTQKVQSKDYSTLTQTIVGKTISGKIIHPKTSGQFEFNQLMDRKDITFALGPAGTGKTYLAVVKAVTLLKKGDVDRIVLTRPAVEAGESLGFLPGDLKEKVDPYLTPLYDCLNEMLGFEQVEKYIEKKVIEIAPLAYMRGRTLNKAFVILDEAQNTTSNQMKMFLTRLGFQSKMVITGDPSQVDLNSKVTSGLMEAVYKCKDIEEIGVIRLESSDVVRNPLVAKIIDAYSK